MKLQKIMMLAVILSLTAWLTPAQADLTEMKKYKEAFPDSKPKCITCHTSEKPKKEAGQHDANAYGKAVIKQAQDPESTTAEDYKKVGSIEEFEKSAGTK
jgi:hypothetical protein